MILEERCRRVIYILRTKENVYQVRDTFSHKVICLESLDNDGVSILQRIVPLHFYIYKHRTNAKDPGILFSYLNYSILHMLSTLQYTYKMHIDMDANKNMLA